MTNAERIVNSLLEAGEQTEFPFGLPSSDDLSRLIHASEVRMRAELEKEHGKQVKDFEFSDHGVQNCQYWQGAGTSYTHWDSAVTGTGSTAYEAAEEALGDAAQDGWDVRGILNPYDANSTDTVEAAVREWNPEAVDEEGNIETEDMYYYVVLYIEGEPPLGEWKPEAPVEEASQPEFPLNDPQRLSDQDAALAADVIDRALAKELRPGEETISGTGIPKDIAQASLDTLRSVHEPGYEEFVASHEEEMEALKNADALEDDTILHEFINSIFDKLTEYCPPYTYFGFYEADGSVGCWPSFDQLREDGENKIIGYNFWEPGTEYSYWEGSDGHHRLYHTADQRLVWEF